MHGCGDLCKTKTTAIEKVTWKIWRTKEGKATALRAQYWVTTSEQCKTGADIVVKGVEEPRFFKFLRENVARA